MMTDFISLSHSRTICSAPAQAKAWVSRPAAIMLFSPFTHAPSLFPPCSLHVPSRTVNLVTTGQTSRRQWLRKSKKAPTNPNVAGKNNAPNPLASQRTKQTKPYRNDGVESCEKRRRNPGCKCRRTWFVGFVGSPWLRNTIYSNHVWIVCFSWMSSSLEVVKEGMDSL